MLPALAEVLSRRKLAFACIAMALVLAALSRHVLHWQLPRLAEPPMIVAALALVAWAALAFLARQDALRRLEAEAQALREAALAFGARAEAWLFATPTGDELEAEALRRAVLDRHSALVAASRAFLLGLDPSDDAVVQAMTRAPERHGRHGAALILHLAALQREALAEAQRRGFLGEPRLLALDAAMTTLTSRLPLPAGGIPRPNQLLPVLTTAYAVLLVLVTSQRLTLVLASAIAATALAAFEALASRPVEAADDPRVAALSSL